jgi:hypothetical protein
MRPVVWRAFSNLYSAGDNTSLCSSKVLYVPLGLTDYAWQEALDLCNQLEVARVMVESALVHEESRGSHYRSDHPEQDDARWLRFIVVRRGPDGEVEVDRRPVKFSRKRPDPADPSAEDLERGEPEQRM